tara:strand:- start:45 stop:341 length:297 start_codon:yes stop_codon:yes gene_type:complete
MLDSIVPYVNDLKKKFLLLMKKYESVLELRDSMLVENKNLSNKVLNLEKEILQLKKRVEVVNIAKGFDELDINSSNIARERVNNLIRDIDKCIALLNE